jgi:hypothetical protein
MPLDELEPRGPTVPTTYIAGGHPPRMPGSDPRSSSRNNSRRSPGAPFECTLPTASPELPRPPPGSNTTAKSNPPAPPRNGGRGCLRLVILTRCGSTSCASQPLQGRGRRVLRPSRRHGEIQQARRGDGHPRNSPPPDPSVLAFCHRIPHVRRERSAAGERRPAVEPRSRGREWCSGLLPTITRCHCVCNTHLRSGYDQWIPEPS